MRAPATSTERYHDFELSLTSAGALFGSVGCGFVRCRFKARFGVGVESPGFLPVLESMTSTRCFGTRHQACGRTHMPLLGKPVTRVLRTRLGLEVLEVLLLRRRPLPAVTTAVSAAVAAAVALESGSVVCVGRGSASFRVRVERTVAEGQRTNSRHHGWRAPPEAIFFPAGPLATIQT